MDKKCPKCNGQRSITCSICNGSGEDRRFGRPQQCHPCHGSGQEECPSCDGKGQIPIEPPFRV